MPLVDVSILLAPDEYILVCCTVEPLYKGHIGTIISVFIIEVSLIQRSFNTLQYYTGTQNCVLLKEVSTFQRFVIETSQCKLYLWYVMHVCSL